jgi:hypothetical protein
MLIRKLRGYVKPTAPRSPLNEPTVYPRFVSLESNVVQQPRLDIVLFTLGPNKPQETAGR